MKSPNILMLMCTLSFTQQLHATIVNPRNCVNIQEKKLETYWEKARPVITNTCDHHIEIAYCQVGENYKNSGCGTGKKGGFYRQKTVINPGDWKENQYTLMSGRTINFAVCVGKYGAIKHLGQDGTYICTSKGRFPAGSKEYVFSSNAQKELEAFALDIKDIQESASLANFIATNSGVVLAVFNHAADNILTLVMMDKNGLEVSYNIGKNIRLIAKDTVRFKCMERFSKIRKNSGRGKKYSGKDNSLWGKMCQGIK
jgi:hypothetical protein